MKSKRILIFCFVLISFLSVVKISQAVDYTAEYWDTDNATSPAIPGTSADFTNTL